jgi:16S rRNA (uracil1498-N3)-methyltransferase
LWVAGLDAMVLIGPEGDFSLEEVLAAKLKGFREVSLGNLRLRTETAGIYVTTLHSILNKER